MFVKKLGLDCHPKQPEQRKTAIAPGLMQLELASSRGTLAVRW